MLNAAFEALVHQRLVGLSRKFNIQTSIFDKCLCLSIESHLSKTFRRDKLSMGEANPFLDEQWLLCNKRFLADSLFWRRQTAAVG